MEKTAAGTPADVSRLVLHIGTHKTATTRIQKLFRRNRDLLARHGVIFPQIGAEDGQHALVGLWNSLMLPDPGFDAAAAWQDLIDRHARGPATVMISSEEFSRMNIRRVDMAALAGLARAFDEVLVLCTLRNQAGFLQSIYQQISGSRPPSDWDAFFARTIEIRMADGLTLDYNRFYSHLLTGFQRRQIRLIAYDRAIRSPGGIVGAYLEALGLPLGPADLVPVSDAEANISPQPLASFTANRLARPAPPPAGLIGLMQRHIDHCFGPGLRTSLLTRAELARMDEVFSPMNQALADRIRPHQPDFSVGPMLGAREGQPGADLFREDLTEAFWIDVCRSLTGAAP
jgi:hypothetical protein